MDARPQTASTPGLSNPSPDLADFIRQEIRAHGPVQFAWFMEQALYHPELGYYAADRCAIGRAGDFFTNVSVGPVFGRLLAAQFIEMWDKLGGNDDFTIVEQGAHHGQLAADVLEWVRRHAPEFFSILRFRLIEPSAALRDRQSRSLAEFGDKVEWRDSVEALEAFNGIYFSNELLDSFPVHIIVSADEQSLETSGGCRWLERCVGFENDRFIFVDRPIADAKLQQQVDRLPARPAGYITEINLQALGWMDAVAAKLTRGYLLTVDYGHTRDEFGAPHRSTGTLQYRSRHRLLDSPFDAVGRSDITAHIHWTDLAERAENRGLRTAGFADQHHFLTGIISGAKDLSQIIGASDQAALKTLLHPEMLGRSFQVLALSKKVDRTIVLSGFKYAPDPRSSLGLSQQDAVGG